MKLFPLYFILLKGVGAVEVIVVNRTTYVHAAQTGKTIDTSLGYFINPLIYCVWSTLAARKITALQKAAIALAGMVVDTAAVLPFYWDTECTYWQKFWSLIACLSL